MKYLIILVILISLIEGFSQYFIKKYTLENKLEFFALALIGYCFVCYLLTLTYKYSTMGIANALWSALSVITIITVGYTFFNETLKNLEIIGIIFVILGVGLINLNN
jgi:multidrug transporter EmrE-like cation transporter